MKTLWENENNKFLDEGYLLLRNQYSADQIKIMREQIDADLKSWQGWLDLSRPSESGTVAHHVLIQKHWIDFLNDLEPYDLFEKLLRAKPTVTTFGVLNNKDADPIYVHENHVDQRFEHLGDHPIMLNLLIFVDDFTSENGATWLYPKSSFPFGESPKSREGGEQMCGLAGDLLIWDSKMLHRAGPNGTGTDRRAVSIMLSCPWIKPQFDYSANLDKMDLASMTEKQKQYLGYWSRVPSIINQWYAPPAERYYQPTQDQKTK